MIKTNDHIGVAEAAEMLGINSRTVHRRILRGDFKFITKLPGLRAPYILSRDEVLIQMAAKS
jgi:hypothetical protein